MTRSHPGIGPLGYRPPPEMVLITLLGILIGFSKWEDRPAVIRSRIGANGPVFAFSRRPVRMPITLLGARHLVREHRRRGAMDRMSWGGLRHEPIPPCT